MHEAVSQTPIYFYRFAYDGKMGLTDIMFGTDRLPGIVQDSNELNRIYRSIRVISVKYINVR
jgi:hypothetical protein